MNTPCPSNRSDGEDLKTTNPLRPSSFLHDSPYRNRVAGETRLVSFSYEKDAENEGTYERVEEKWSRGDMVIDNMDEDDLEDPYAVTTPSLSPNPCNQKLDNESSIYIDVHTLGTLDVPPTRHPRKEDSTSFTRRIIGTLKKKVLRSELFPEESNRLQETYQVCHNIEDRGRAPLPRKSKRHFHGKRFSSKRPGHRRSCHDRYRTRGSSGSKSAERNCRPVALWTVLVAGYAILVMVAVVIGLAVSQRSQSLADNASNPSTRRPFVLQESDRRSVDEKRVIPRPRTTLAPFWPPGNRRTINVEPEATFPPVETTSFDDVLLEVARENHKYDSSDQAESRTVVQRHERPFLTRPSFELPPQRDVFKKRNPQTVTIKESWSFRNDDGSLSWGYVNSDGSFKNETRGPHCVVRGVYGYIDPETGETRVFPYESGNPCDQDTVDYYFEYNPADLIIPGTEKVVRSS